MELKITPEFTVVCEDIKNQNWAEPGWVEHEADDWFQIKLDEVNDILVGKIDKVETRRVKE